MKILHTADWHIGNFSGPVDKDGQNLRAVDTGMCLNHLHDIALLRKPDMILVSGDIFHQARVWADRGLSEVQTAIRVIETLGSICPVVVMRGTPNHDGEEQFESLREYFSSSSTIRIITRPCVLQICGVNIACLPGFDRGIFRAKFPGLSKEEESRVFTEEISKIVLGLKAKCHPAMKSVLMAHYTVPGCNTESGQTQFFAQFEPVLMPETLDAAGWDLVAMGHIHRPQHVESCRNTFYCGAVNALNFNDEGQKRGFYIHDLDTDTHSFYETPARQFLTIHMDSRDIGDYIDQGYLPGNLFMESRDKIVRVLYTCTEEQNKALNRAEMEHDLYNAFGAFWVAGIEPEKVTIGTSKEELSEKTNPEKNLVDYLKEKGLPDADMGAIVEAARPIIAEATVGNQAARYTGAFVPISIEVKNYRNYSDEHFDFKNVSFCTINGKNGAGKSSLFMDAILDCLFEEPREGDLTGWIRADESARSGSIIFTFSIGEHVFRVTRTRTKSGKATLNLAEQIEGEWQNRSCEKLKDTQKKIIDVIGMDSLTFRSCALIMQDQYGLFLEASKEDRMTILGNILGLGIYDSMTIISKQKNTDVNREIIRKKDQITQLEYSESRETDLSNQIAHLEQAREEKSVDKQKFTAIRDSVAAQLQGKKQASERAEKLLSSCNTLQKKKSATEELIREQKAIISEVTPLIAQSDAIATGVCKYNNLLEQEKSLITENAMYTNNVNNLDRINGEIETLKLDIRKAQIRRQATNMDVDGCSTILSNVSALEDAAKQYEQYSSDLEDIQKRSQKYIALSNSISKIQKELGDARAAYNAEVSERVTTLRAYQHKAELLQDSECPISGGGDCRFLADAKNAAARVQPYTEACTRWKNESFAKLKKLQNNLKALESELTRLSYDPLASDNIKSSMATLLPQVEKYKNLDATREKLKAAQGQLQEIDESVSSLNQKMSKLQIDAVKVASEVDRHETAADDYKKLLSELAANKVWIEKEKQLPAAQGAAATAEKQITELHNLVEEYERDINDKNSDYEKEKSAAEGSKSLNKQLTDIDTKLTAIQSSMYDLTIQLGAAQQKLKDCISAKKQTSVLMQSVHELSHAAAIYETLKAAFSQDGIPHNIIRSMLPLLTTTANTILGQMTGGKMGMEFITDKILKSNSRKEVPTLDIIINEYGKDSLPYLSKSGGEKVKASLSAILSLAEIKSSQAGIQLGMLFIDEPPFLDEDGIQAYCDALETIQHRYSGLKVMAITHDPEMKARFPQSIDIIKDDTGSHVLME